MAKLFANSGDPDQTPHSAASDLGLHCLPITLLRVSNYNGLKVYGYTWGFLLPVFKEDNYCNYPFVSLHISTLLSREEFAPFGSSSFILLEKTTFHKRAMSI